MCSRYPLPERSLPPYLKDFFYRARRPHVILSDMILVSLLQPPSLYNSCQFRVCCSVLVVDYLTFNPLPSIFNPFWFVLRILPVFDIQCYRSHS